jgi:transcriptional regulator with XRE-family HTH domain
MSNKSPFTEFLSARIEKSGLSQVAIADAIGYCNSNIVSMFKNGVTKVPLDRLPPLAKCLDVNQSELVELWLKSYRPEWVEIVSAR